MCSLERVLLCDPSPCEPTLGVVYPIGCVGITDVGVPAIGALECGASDTDDKHIGAFPPGVCPEPVPRPGDEAAHGLEGPAGGALLWRVRVSEAGGVEGETPGWPVPSDDPCSPRCSPDLRVFHPGSSDNVKLSEPPDPA